MPRWGFDRESTQVASGANTIAGRVKGYQAPFIAGDASEMAEKRNVIATSLGWIRRENRSSVHGGTRTIDQVIVAANPAVPNKDYTSNTYLGNPDVSQIYIKLNANGYISANATNVNLYVVFNTPMHFKPSGNQVTLTIANTAGGNHAVSNFANNATQNRIINANNTLVFRLPPLQGGAGSVAATYRVNAQAMAVTGMPLYNPDDDTTVSANLVITGAVSNNLCDGIGNRIGTFQVRRNG